MSALVELKPRRSDCYRALPEAERLALARAIVAESLKGFRTRRATLTPTRALKRHFKRVTSYDAKRFADDVKSIRFFAVANDAGEHVWEYKGKLRKDTATRIVFERLEGEALARARRLIALRILSECEAKLGVKAKLVIRRYRARSAFCNLKTGTIYLNESLLGLEEGVIRYLIAHELAHLRRQSRYHDGEFYRLLYSVVSPEEAREAVLRIEERLLQLAGGARGRG
jgi:predicted metal-dependent hydrolase